MQEKLVWLRIFTNTVYLSWSIDREQYLKLDARSESTRLYLQLFCSSFELINLQKYNLHNLRWVIKITRDCWRFLISRLITFRTIFAIFTATIFTLYHMPMLR